MQATYSAGAAHDRNRLLRRGLGLGGVALALVIVALPMHSVGLSMLIIAGSYTTYCLLRLLVEPPVHFITEASSRRQSSVRSACLPQSSIPSGSGPAPIGLEINGVCVPLPTGCTSVIAGEVTASE